MAAPALYHARCRVVATSGSTIRARLALCEGPPPYAPLHPPNGTSSDANKASSTAGKEVQDLGTKRQELCDTLRPLGTESLGMLLDALTADPQLVVACLKDLVTPMPAKAEALPATPAPVSYVPSGPLVVVELGSASLLVGWGGAVSPKVELGAPPCDGGVSPELRASLLDVAEQLEFGWDSHAAVVVVPAGHEHAFHEQLLELFLLELGAPAVSAANPFAYARTAHAWCSERSAGVCECVASL